MAEQQQRHHKELESLVQEGYYIQPGMIAEPFLSRLRDALDEVALRERVEGTGEISRSQGFGGQFIRHLFDKHPVFLELLQFPPTLTLVRAALGPSVRARLSARISFPDEPNQQTEWHAHTAPPPDPMPPLYSFPHSLDVLIYLDAVNAANGLLYVLPQSHTNFNTGIQSKDFSDKPGQVAVEMQPGDGVFVHNHLWHRATPTTPQGTVRRMLALTYYPSWFKNSPVDGLPPLNGETQRLIETGDSEILELLGLK
jgi:ectoine hydroxylase-related dioxygenase (phytanoyl-CoA dioxygenase family)